MPRVHGDAGPFHPFQHRDQGAFHGLVDRGHVLECETGLEDPVQAPCNVRVLGRVVQGLVQGHLVEGELFLAAADDVGVLDGVPAEVEFRQRVHAVAVEPAVEHIRQHHGVVNRRDGDAEPGQDLHVVLDVLPHLEDCRVPQKGGQQGQGLERRDLRRARR